MNSPTTGNNNNTILVVVGIVIFVCCLLLSSAIGGYFIYRNSTGTTSGSGTKPTGYTTITATDAYGCPAQTFKATTKLSDGSYVWEGSAAGDSKRYLVFDSSQNKLYCCKDPNTCNFGKGGYFYGYDINDTKVTYS